MTRACSVEHTSTTVTLRQGDVIHHLQHVPSSHPNKKQSNGTSVGPVTSTLLHKGWHNYILPAHQKCWHQNPIYECVGISESRHWTTCVRLIWDVPQQIFTSDTKAFQRGDGNFIWDRYCHWGSTPPDPQHGAVIYIGVCFICEAYFVKRLLYVRNITTLPYRFRSPVTQG